MDPTVPDDVADFEKELREAAQIADPTERLLECAAIVAAALSSIGVRPVVVGGLAVAYWLEGEYTTFDIDVLMPATKEIDDRMQELGFEKRGREWVLPDAAVAFEAPGWALEPGAQAAIVELRSGRTLSVLRAEDVLIDRLHQFHSGGHRDVFEQAIGLALLPLDQKTLHDRARSERIEHVLEAIFALARRTAAGERFESWELHDIANRLRKGGFGKEANADLQ